MKVQPRQQLLDIWHGVARHSYADGEWRWGFREGRNSVSDAEQLLCLMYPAAEIASFSLERPDHTSDDVLHALARLGSSVEIPRTLVSALLDYMQTYSHDGTPLFPGGSYFGAEDPGREITEEQRGLDVVEAFASSIQLSLATLAFAKVFRTVITRRDLLEAVNDLESLAGARLSAAMVGLLRSFSVQVFESGSLAAQSLVGMLNQANEPEGRVTEALRESLGEVRAGLRDLSVGSGHSGVDLDDPTLLFECGWSWGIVREAPRIDTSEPIGFQPEGLAPNTPYLYFTVSALESIRDLSSERTRLLGLLNEEQQRFANALQLRWDLTQRYWATIATFGAGRWPIEDVPWRTSDGEESEYFTLLVTSMVAHNFERRRAGEADLARVTQVLGELASRGRITRRALADDTAVIRLHAPGVALALPGSEKLGSSRLTWVVTDYAVVLLGHLAHLARQSRSTELRGEMLELIDSTWEHLHQRRMTKAGGGSLWDDPSAIFPGLPPPVSEKPSWYYTQRVVKALVQLARLAASSPLRSERLTQYAMDLLLEAEHAFDQELLNGSMEAGPSMQYSMRQVRARLRRARKIVPERPGSASALALAVLRDLDLLVAARQDAGIG
ncbi:SCO2524 family protein [Cryptosporangium minutisporangium]|uniref:SCO2524 family protein n=1 Tax=Cryptosporangium minutisporangium TaxID=113569 RepID=A0ABP6T475_9ACTN